MHPALATALILIQAAAPAVDGSRFGRAVLALDDLNDDGVSEFAVGAPTHESHRGAVFVFCGKSQERIAIWRGPEARRTFGHALRSTQDVDGDGIEDVLVGYEFSARTELRSGKEGRMIHAIDRAWQEVIPFGDFDGDGAGDLLITAGSLWEVRSGRSNALLNGCPSALSGGRFDPIGDVNGDGLVDGIYFGKTVVPMLTLRPADEDLRLARPFSTGSRDVITHLWPWLKVDAGKGAAKAPVPWRAAPGGDLDGDGQSDILLVSTSDSTSSVMGLSLADRSKPLITLRAPSPGSFGGEPLGAVTLGGLDLDGDSRDDLVASGAVHLFDGQVLAAPGAAPGPVVQSAWPAFEGSLWAMTWSIPSAIQGVSLAAFDDVDDDGARDLLVGLSDWFWHGTVDANGSVRLVSGRTGQVIWILHES